MTTATQPAPLFVAPNPVGAIAAGMVANTWGERSFAVAMQRAADDAAKEEERSRFAGGWGLTIEARKRTQTETRFPEGWGLTLSRKPVRRGR